MLLYLLIIQLMVYNRTITRFAADDKLFISEWDWIYDWLRTTAEHDIIWSMWAGDHGQLFFCIHLNRQWQFHAKSNELTDAFLACPRDWAQGPSLLCEWQTRSTAAWLLDNSTRRVASVQQTVDASNFQTLVGQFTQEPSCTILLWQIEIFNQNHIFLWNFHDFV